MKRKIGRNGTRYYDVDFDIIIQFGLTEFKAQIAWIENVGFFSITHRTHANFFNFRVLKNGGLMI
jgi:hypothetical protein